MNCSQQKNPGTGQRTESIRASGGIRRGTTELAFTFTELLVVIGTLLVLAATLATALASTRPNSLTFRCLNNLRQLGLGWRMYSEDYQGWLVYNHDGQTGKDFDHSSWAGGWLDDTTSSDNTNTDLLINHTRYRYSAYFGPYLKTASVFKCPADRSTVRVIGGGERVPRVRTVSMNGVMGQGGETPAGQNSLYATYTKANQLGAPAKLFVMLDEREDSINDAFFWIDTDRRFWIIDFPASYHDGGGNFVFGDGHGETHLWTDPRTTPPIQSGPFLYLNLSIPGDLDIDWLQQHASERR